MPRRVISTMTKFPAKGSLQHAAALCFRIAKEDFNRADQTRLGEFQSGNGQFEPHQRLALPAVPCEGFVKS